MNDFISLIEDMVRSLLKKENLIARVLSVVVACLLWLYVAIDKNPMLEQDYDVRLSHANLPETMTVYNAPETVRVRLRGPRNLMNSKQGSELRASIDLKHVGKGQQKLNVKAATKYGQIVTVSPSAVSVYVDTISQKQVSVYTRMVGNSSEDMTMGNVRIEPNKVTVRGATQRLETVNKVMAPVDVTSKEGPFQAESELVAINDDGYDVPNMSITPQKVLVSATMMPQLFTVDLPVEIVYEGKLAEGLEMKSIKLEPEKIRISASPSKLKGLTAIKTKPLDYSKLKTSGILALELDLPDKAIAEARVIKADLTIGKIDSEPVRESVGTGNDVDMPKEKKHEAKN